LVIKIFAKITHEISYFRLLKYS